MTNAYMSSPILAPIALEWMEVHIFGRAGSLWLRAFDMMILKSLTPMQAC